MRFFDPFAEFDRFVPSTRPGGFMPMDMYELDGMYFLKFDLAGIDPDTIEITVEKQVLTVTVDRPAEDTEGANWLVRERPAGKHSRQLRLGATLDGANIDAAYDQGVLTVRIPVREEAKPHRVAVKSIQPALN